LIRAASQPFWKEVNTQKVQSPPMAGRALTGTRPGISLSGIDEIPKNQRSRQVETLFPLTG
jgi:hypothetical protein